MSKIRIVRALKIMTVLSIIGITPAHAQPPAVLGSTLYTTYDIPSSDQSVSWIVCGSTQETEGCYASGSLGPFGTVGALLEGNPTTTKGDTVTRDIYVLDIASGSGANGVELYVYKKTDTITSESDSVSVTLSKTINLPLVGGSGALCSMAANNHFLFIGTNQSPQAVKIEKSNLGVTQLGNFSPPINFSAITVDNYGYITVTQGGFNGGESGFTVFGPNGNEVEDGGGAPVMLNTQTAVLPAAFPTSASQHAQREVGYRLKASVQEDPQK